MFSDVTHEFRKRGRNPTNFTEEAGTRNGGEIAESGGGAAKAGGGREYAETSRRCDVGAGDRRPAAGTTIRMRKRRGEHERQERAGRD